MSLKRKVHNDTLKVPIVKVLVKSKLTDNNECGQNLMKSVTKH